jgi:hypothetical protein
VSKNTLLTVLLLPLVIVYGDFIAWSTRSIIEKTFRIRIRRSKWFHWLGMRGIDRLFILLITCAALLLQIGNPIFWLFLAAAMFVSLLNFKGIGLTIGMRGLQNEKNENRLK